MAKFDFGTKVQIIETGRRGMVSNRERNKIAVAFYDINYMEPEEGVYKASDLCVVDIPQIETSQFRAFVRGELSLEEITDGTNLVPNYAEDDSKKYKMTAIDLLAGVKAYENMPPEDVYKWIDMLEEFGEEISYEWDFGEDITDEVKEKDVLEYVYDEIDAIKWHILEDEPLEMTDADFEEIKKSLMIWIESGGKEYPEGIIRKIVSQYDNNDIDRQSEKTQEMFKKCLDYLCDKKDAKAIQKRGYCYYCGTKIYPNDWIKARDAFIDYYQMTGDASAANTLGYIYYYGRCNGGEPEYEEAFKYFSIGHAYSYYESTYKLADMLAHGYGVVKDGESARHLYWSVYKNNWKQFITEDYECKFADAALRMGNCFRDGIGVDKEIETAYMYYLQADLAIRKRTEVANHYGDTVVFNGVQKALEETRKEYTKKGRTEKFIYPGWIKWVLIKHRRCRLTFRELKSGVISISATPMKRYDDKKVPKILITIPKADYCALRDTIHIKTAGNSTYKIMDGSKELIFDHVEYDWVEKKTSFYLFEDLVGELCTEYYTITAPATKKIVPSGEVYHFVSICFEKTGRCYDYLCDEKSVKEGDMVVVDGYDGETVVKVVSVSDKYENELGLPLERYKKIIRKDKR